jgi:hypothetical protein
MHFTAKTQRRKEIAEKNARRNGVPSFKGLPAIASQEDLQYIVLLRSEPPVRSFHIIEILNVDFL